MLCVVEGFKTRANRGESRSANRMETAAKSGGGKANLILRPRFLRLSNGGNAKTRFRMATRASPTGPAHQLSAFMRWFGVPQTTRTR